MKAKPSLLLPALLMAAFALTRIPGMLPENFSAAYALAFCAGVYFPGRLAWWLPIGTLLVTDLLLNLYYLVHLGIPTFQPANLLYLCGNYLAYFALIGLGRKFSARSSWLALLGGGLLGAALFYFVTNTLSWLFNPFGNLEYTRDFAGWLRALTLGTANWPHTWEFFRNTLASGGLFTGLFAGAMKACEAPETEEEEEPAEEPAEGEAEESKA
jgi:hypothetical protein